MTFPPALLDVFSQPAISVALERFIGYPNWLYRLIGHPVTWMGALITYMDEKMNTTAHVKSLSRLNGVLAMLLLCACVWFAATAFLALVGIVDPDFGFHVSWGRLLRTDFAGPHHETCVTAQAAPVYAYNNWIYTR